MNRERLWILMAGGAVLLLAIVVLVPMRKEDSPKLWSTDWTALEFESSGGLVHIEKASGWYADQFLIRLPDRAPRLASPAVKSFFLDLQSPAVKGEYLLSEKEATEIFAEPRCVVLLRSSDRREICAGRISGGQAFVRLREDPLRAYMMPEYVFGRLRADPETWIEKRLFIMPSGTVPDRIHVRFQDNTIDLKRKKEKVEGGDRVHWFAGDREISLNLANNLLSTLYGLQRDRLVEEAIPQVPLAEAVVDVVTESPSIEGIFRGALGSGRVTVRIYSPRTIEKDIFYPASSGIDQSADLVSKAGIDRLVAAIAAIKNPPTPRDESPAGH